MVRAPYPAPPRGFAVASRSDKAHRRAVAAKQHERVFARSNAIPRAPFGRG